MDPIAENQVQPPSIFDSLKHILRNSCAMLSEMIAIGALEVRLASVSLVMIIGAGIGIVLLMLSTWLMILAAIGYLMVNAGYPLGSTLFILAAINVVGIIPLLFMISSCLKNLSFHKTREQTKNMVLLGE